MRAKLILKMMPISLAESMFIMDQTFLKSNYGSLLLVKGLLSYGQSNFEDNRILHVSNMGHSRSALMAGVADFFFKPPNLTSCHLATISIPLWKDLKFLKKYFGLMRLAGFSRWNFLSQ